MRQSRACRGGPWEDGACSGRGPRACGPRAVSAFVVDASVGAKWWFPEAHHDAASRLRDPAHDLHAPDLFDLEVASLVCKRIRRSELSEAEADRVVTLLEHVPVRRHPDRDLLRP